MTDSLSLLNTAQRQAYDAVEMGKHIFLTGPGGTGKSFLLQMLYTVLPGRITKKVALTALTGCAALLVHPRAKTLHSWAGVGLAKESATHLIKEIRKSRKSSMRWITTDVLVIDEISMMTPELFEKLDEIGRAIRRTPNQPFGGIQLVLVGDFYQLPPVVRQDISGVETCFLFESPLWNELKLETHSLTEIVRQKDPIFQEVLNQARRGELTKKSIKVLATRMGLDYKTQAIQPTMLFTRRAEVDEINMSHLRKLTTERRSFKATTLFQPLESTKGLTEEDPFVKRAILKLDTDAPYNAELTLAIGAQVMLLVNKPDLGLANGSRGVITGFGPPPTVDAASSIKVDDSLLVPFVKFRNGLTIPIEHNTWEVPDFPGVLRKQIPLRLAYAITIHKCVDENTLLSIPNKGLVKIKEFVNISEPHGTLVYTNDMFVAGIASNKKIVEVYKGYVEDALELKTSFGYEIIGSMRHPLLILNPETHAFEWKILPDIKINDYIVIKKGASVEGSYYTFENYIQTKNASKKIKIPSYLNEDFGYLLGSLLGDGSVNKKTYRVDFISSDFDIIERCICILKDIFDIHIEFKVVKNRNIPTWRFFFHSKEFIHLLDSIQYNFGIANTKEIPEVILQSPLTVQKAVLQGLYDTDGGVSLSTINFTTTSYNMGKQIQEMLLNIGIVSSRNILHEENKEKKRKTAYRLNISGYSAIQFNKLIGFSCVRKKDSSEKRFKETASLRKNLKSQAFTIPNAHILIQNLRNEIRGNLKKVKSTSMTPQCNKLMSSIINKSQKLRYETLQMLVKDIPNISNYTTGKLLSFMYENGILIDTVKSFIKKQDIQMYDIGVSPENACDKIPDGHDFIAGGFVNHNSQGSTLDCALVDIGNKTFEYGQAYVALSRVKDLESLYIHDFEPTAVRAHPKVKEFYSK
jgi:intein/homing endonuclease/energy-coupling factor transporter ATP-binding protein EcfA2